MKTIESIQGLLSELGALLLKFLIYIILLFISLTIVLISFWLLAKWINYLINYLS